MTKEKRNRLFYYRFYCLIFSVLLLASCEAEKKTNALRFKYGTFVIPATANYGKTIIKRIDSLQIEQYYKTITISNDSATFKKEEISIDTLYIKWVTNFKYVLKMKNPKTDLDKDPIFVQINKVTDSSYNFTAKIGYSNFKQKGTIFIKN